MRPLARLLAGSSSSVPSALRFVPREPSHVPRDHASIVARLATLVADDPAIFLERYGELCSKDELNYYFDSRVTVDEDSYELRWHLARLRRTAAEASTTIRNRRYRCMLELEGEGFFSDHNMQTRAPQIFHNYVGRLLPASTSPATERHCFDEDTPLSSNA